MCTYSMKRKTHPAEIKLNYRTINLHKLLFTEEQFSGLY